MIGEANVKASEDTMLSAAMPLYNDMCGCHSKMATRKEENLWENSQSLLPPGLGG